MFLKPSGIKQLPVTTKFDSSSNLVWFSVYPQKNRIRLVENADVNLKTATRGIPVMISAFEKYPGVFLLFELRTDEIMRFGEIKTYAVKNAVIFAVHSTFSAVKPHENYLAPGFTGKTAYDDFRWRNPYKYQKKGLHTL